MKLAFCIFKAQNSGTVKCPDLETPCEPKRAMVQYKYNAIFLKDPRV